MNAAKTPITGQKSISEKRIRYARETFLLNSLGVLVE